jgi:hypothetical protein
MNFIFSKGFVKESVGCSVIQMYANVISPSKTLSLMK